MSEAWWTTEKGLLPNFIKRERINQTDPFFVVANPEAVVLELSYADVDNAANRAAWFLSKNLAQDEEKFFYMGRMDLRYYIWALGAMKAGKCVGFGRVLTRTAVLLTHQLRPYYPHPATQ